MVSILLRGECVIVFEIFLCENLTVLKVYFEVKGI